MTIERSSLTEAIEAILRGTLSEQDAARLFDRGREAVIFVLLALAKRQAEPTSPHRPSSATPLYEKPASKIKRSKKRGAKPGHPGKRRPPPSRIDRREEHRLPCCPDCGSRLKRTADTRTRYVEDIPDDLRPITTEHTLHRDWCVKCKKRVEPTIPDALPRCQLGIRTLVLSAWLHYGLGNTLSQITEVFAHHLQLPLSEGGLCQMWSRLAETLEPWREQLQREALASAKLHADETGWRVDGKTHWLWCFANDDVTFYIIDRSRGSPALQKFFTEEFSGTLITDFWAAYESVCAGDRQKCWAHLLRELDAIDSSDDEWLEFRKRVKRLFADAVRLHARRDTLAEEAYDLRVSRLELRVATIAAEEWNSPDAVRLAKRLKKHGHELFTFLWYDDVDPTNNHGEREIRPAVIIRKNSHQNASARGAQTQAALMSVLRTLRRRGHNAIDVLEAALRTYAATTQLPPMPANICSDG